MKVAEKSVFIFLDSSSLPRSWKQFFMEKTMASITEITIVELIEKLRQRVWIYLAIPIAACIISVLVGFSKPKEYVYMGLVRTECISNLEASALLSMYVETEKSLDDAGEIRIAKVATAGSLIKVFTISEKPKMARKGLDLAVRLIDEKISRSIFSFIISSEFKVFLANPYGKTTIFPDFSELVVFYEELCGELEEHRVASRLIEAVEKSGHDANRPIKFAILGLTVGLFLSFIGAYGAVAMRTK